MSLALSDTYDLVRAVLGDFNATYQRYPDAALLSVLRSVLRFGQVEGYTLSNDSLGMEPSPASAKPLAILIYKAALRLLLPNAASYAYETRALRERFGEQKQFVTELQELIYQEENGEVFGTFQSFYAWLNGVTGQSLAGQLVSLEVGPLPTLTLNTGLTDGVATVVP